MHASLSFTATAFVLFVACGSSAARAPVEPIGVVAQAPDGFWERWGDGKAEIDGYRLTTPRYGQLRRGEAVQIWVTETFTGAQRVKSDGGHPDEYPVLKLNDVRHFQTGIYDYHVMGQGFSRIDGRQPLGQPVKVTLGVQEWCGQIYEEWLGFPGHYLRARRSYFDGESADDRHDVPAGGILADQAALVARGLVGTVDGVVPWVSSLLDQRLLHREPAWTTATIHRDPAVDITVPAGAFRAIPVRFDVAEGTGYTFWVEEAEPHRIVRWERPDGELAELTGSIRTPYWSQNGEGLEKLRADLGLGEPSWLGGDPP